MDKTLKFVIILFLLIAAIKIILTFFVTSPTIFADEYFYSKMAQSYFNFREFSIHSELTKAYPPLYSVLISPAYIFKNMMTIYSVIKIINAVISSLIIFPAYFFAKEFLSSKKALLSSILISVLPANLAFSSYVMSENLFYLLFLISLYFIYKSFKEDNLMFDAFAGIFIGLTILTRYLGFALLIPVLVLVIYHLLIGKKILPKLLLLGIVGLIISAWLFRNGYLFGFTIDGLLGTYIRDGYPVTFTPLSMFIWTIINFGIVIASTGFIFTLSILSNIKQSFSKNKILYVILFSVMLAVLVMLAERTAGSALFKVDTLLALTGRPSARYFDVLAPLVIIGGLVSMNQQKVSRNVIIFLGIVMLFTSQLIFFQLFPVNNMSLLWLGAISYTTKALTSNLFSLTAIALIALMSGVAVSKFLLERFKPNKLVVILIIAFLVLSAVNVAVISINSTNWRNSNGSQIGLWADENLSGIFLIDEKYCNEFDFRQQGTLCSKNNKVSLIGFWIKDEIRIGDPNEIPVNYIITRDILTLEKIYELDGTFIYKSA